MNLDELRSVQSKERKKDSLQNLRPSFYQEVGEYIADLEDERDRVAEATDDPFSSPEVSRLTDEIETAKDVVEAIYERRMGKLVKQASLAAAGMAADDEGLTAEEADLFDDLVDRIGANKSRVLDVLEGVEEPATDTGTDASRSSDDPDARPGGSPPDRAPGDDAPPIPPDDPPTATGTDASASAAEEGADDPSSGVSPADVMGGDGPPVDGPDGPTEETAVEPPATQAPGDEPDRGRGSADAPSSAGTGPDTADSTVAESDATAQAGDQTAAVDRTTVRITTDIGSILGVDDREYTLTADDVVTLPEQNAAPLVEREAAERLE